MNIYKEIEAEIQAAAHIVITAHKSADGDSIGSSLGLLHFIEKLGKKAVVCHPDKAPDFLYWLDTTSIILMEENPGRSNSANEKSRFDFLFRLQCNQPCRDQICKPY